jgi:hypothetical protein
VCECGKEIEGCVEQCGMCFAAMMEREESEAPRPCEPWVPTVPDFKAKHMSIVALAAANAALVAERHARLLAFWGEVATARIEGR